MRGVKKKKINIGTLAIGFLFLLCILLVVFAVTISLIYMDKQLKGGGIEWEILKLVTVFVSILISFFIQIILHEGGHLIFGLLSGYEFISFRIGSVTLVKDDEAWKIKKFNLPGTGGQCLMMPPETTEGKLPFIMFNLGGVIMNLIFGIIPILTVIFVKDIFLFLKGFLIIFGVIGIISALLNGIPLKVSGVANDGSNLLEMVKDKEARRAFYLQLRFNGLLSKGQRPREIRLEEVKLGEEADISMPLNTAVILMEYNYYLDNMEFQRGRELLNSLNPYRNNILGLYKLEIDCERIFLELVLNGDKGLVHRLYNKELVKYIKACKGMINKKRVMMAYELLYNEDEKVAKKFYEEGKEVAKIYPLKGEIYMELMLMDYLNNLKVETLKSKDI